ncbi:hypothetical protein [Armatimonas sp.]|uniref:hypothetical protein n=1 Tax=Armatimonas sp. TaxID=1872638 RepID=UPI003753A75B
MPKIDPAKERWWYVREKGTSYALKSELFASHDDEHLFKNSGARSGRRGWRNWFPSREEALAEYLKALDKRIEQAQNEVNRRMDDRNHFAKFYGQMLQEADLHV